MSGQHGFDDMCWVYILISYKDEGYYIGSTTRLSERLERHFSGRVRSTKSRLPLELVYSEETGSLGEARNRENQMKREKSKSYIERLIRKKSV